MLRTVDGWFTMNLNLQYTFFAASYGYDAGQASGEGRGFCASLQTRFRLQPILIARFDDPVQKDGVVPYERGALGPLR